MSLYDAAMLSSSSYTKVGLQAVTFFGATVAAIGFIVAIALILTGILKDDGSGAFHAAALFGLFFLGAALLAAIGFAREYLMNVNLRGVICKIKGLRNNQPMPSQIDGSLL